MWVMKSMSDRRQCVSESGKGYSLLEGGQEEDVFGGFGESDAGERKLKHFVICLVQMRLYVLSLLD
jgi:hypothetical protein